jgi:hypothetical protein
LKRSASWFVGQVMKVKALHFMTPKSRKTPRPNL